MITVSASGLIPANIDQLWTKAGNPMDMPGFHPAFDRAELLKGGETPVPGDRLRWYFTLGKRTGHYDEEITAYEPGQYWETRNIGGENIPPFELAITRLDFAAEGEATNVTLTVTVELRNRWRQILFSGLFRKQYAKYLPAILEKLEGLVTPEE